jgi:hypothetical protein
LADRDRFRAGTYGGKKRQSARVGTLLFKSVRQDKAVDKDHDRKHFSRVGIGKTGVGRFLIISGEKLYPNAIATLGVAWSFSINRAERRVGASHDIGKRMPQIIETFGHEQQSENCGV